MERVYLLLRNNQESGPFTIGELLQQQLKPEDMVWVEGKSKAWTYLSELQLLPIVDSISEENKPAKPADEIENKAEELRRRILSSPTMYYAPKEVERGSYSPPYYLPEKELEFVDHRKEKITRRNAVAGELALTGIVIGLFVLGIYKGNSFLSEKKQVQNSVATQLNTNDEHTAHKKNNQTPAVVINASDSIQKMNSKNAVVKAKPKTGHAIRHDSAIIHDSLQKNNLIIAPSDKKQDATAQKTVDQSAVTIKNESLAKKEDGSAKKETVGSGTRDDKKSVEEPQEKKKGFFLKNLFKKKKKESQN